MARGALVTTGVLVALVLTPAFAPRGWDDFPLSSYPMFARADLGREVALDRVRLVREDGSEGPAPPSALGTPEPMVAMKVVSGAVARGEARALCARVLAYARSLPPDGQGHARVREAQVETVTYDTTRYFEDPTRRASRVEVHARCSVEVP